MAAMAHVGPTATQSLVWGRSCPEMEFMERENPGRNWATGFAGPVDRIRVTTEGMGSGCSKP
eukprot:16439257-Heterocapsa_arctica.AAC.1